MDWSTGWVARALLVSVVRDLGGYPQAGGKSDTFSGLVTSLNVKILAFLDMGASYKYSEAKSQCLSDFQKNLSALIVQWV